MLNGRANANTEQVVTIAKTKDFLNINVSPSGHTAAHCPLPQIRSTLLNSWVLLRDVRHLVTTAHSLEAKDHVNGGNCCNQESEGGNAAAPDLQAEVWSRLEGLSSD